MDKIVFETCQCANCGGKIEFPSEGQGMNIACPHCGQKTKLEVSHQVLLEKPPINITNILADVSHPISIPTIPFRYICGLVLVAIAMLCLPVCYIALICTVIWGMVYWATHFVGLVNSMPAGFKIYLCQLLIYGTPISAGIITCFFMLKPLFKRNHERIPEVVLSPHSAPLLFSYVTAIARTIGAPTPSFIVVNCGMNVAAIACSSVRGFAKNEYGLMLGLPFVTGMDLRQFSGILAHELSHFKQGFAVRLIGIIARINSWFSRVVFERDNWDADLDEMTGASYADRDTVVLSPTRFCVWLTRQVLKMLMYAGCAISGFLSRQMEYNADQYQILLAGSKAFETTALRAGELHAAYDQALKNMKLSYLRSRCLPDNFPAFLIYQTSKISPAEREQIHDQEYLRTSSWLSTHPTPGDRIKMARQMNKPGMTTLDLPATVLFDNFETLAMQCTLLLYQYQYGVLGNSIRLCPVTEQGIQEDI